MEWVVDVVLFAAGYAAAVYTWDKARTIVTGVEAEVARLRARIMALKG